MVQPKFKILIQEEKDSYGKFIFEPLPANFGVTLGNALRRTLLESIVGAAIVEAEIGGARHQFQTLPGLKQDLVEFILNLKKVRFAFQDVKDGENRTSIRLEKIGPGQIKAGHLQCPAGLEVVNKDLYLGELTGKKNKLKAKFVVQKGFGYLPADEMKKNGFNTILIDALFTPVLKVAYQTQPISTGKHMKSEKLILEIWTDSSLTPSQALKTASQTIASFFQEIYQPTEHPADHTQPDQKLVSETLLKTSLEELELPTRIVNALRRGKIETIDDLLKTNPKKLAGINNFGEKSLKLVKKILKAKGINYHA